MNHLIGLVAFAFLSYSNNTPTSTIENTDSTNISNTTNTVPAPTDNRNTITNTQESGSNHNTLKTENGLISWYTDLAQAKKASLKEKKPLLLFFTGSDWSMWCIRLQKEVFSKPEFKKWADSNVILVELDFPREKKLPDDFAQEKDQLRQELGVKGYPTVWLIKLVELSGEKVQLSPLGSLGYKAGGPSVWLKSANAILSNNK